MSRHVVGGLALAYAVAESNALILRPKSNELIRVFSENCISSSFSCLSIGIIGLASIPGSLWIPSPLLSLISSSIFIIKVYESRSKSNIAALTQGGGPGFFQEACFNKKETPALSVIQDIAESSCST